jgi:hypothetical protein
MFANLRPRIVDFDGEMAAWSISHSVPSACARASKGGLQLAALPESVRNVSAISRCRPLGNIVFDRSGPSGWRNGTTVSLLLVRDCFCAR